VHTSPLPSITTCSAPFLSLRNNSGTFTSLLAPSLSLQPLPYLPSPVSPISQAVWDAVAEDVVALYQRLSDACVPGPHLDQLHDRALKHLLLSIIVAGAATPSVFASRAPSPVTATVNVSAGLCGILCSPSILHSRTRLYAPLVRPPLPHRPTHPRHDCHTLTTPRPTTTGSTRQLAHSCTRTHYLHWRVPIT
jgi:hypothetical protein